MRGVRAKDFGPESTEDVLKGGWNRHAGRYRLKIRMSERMW